MKDDRSLEDILETARSQRASAVAQEQRQRVDEAEAEQRKIRDDQYAALTVAHGVLPAALHQFVTCPDRWDFQGVNNLSLQIPGCVEIHLPVCMKFDKGNLTRPLGHEALSFKVPYLFSDWNYDMDERLVKKTWNNAVTTKNVTEAIGVAQDHFAEYETLAAEAIQETLAARERLERRLEEPVREPSLAERLVELIQKIAASNRESWKEPR